MSPSNTQPRECQACALQQLAAAQQALRDAQTEAQRITHAAQQSLTDAVYDARKAGLSWQRIGNVLGGITRQSAHGRWS